MFPKLTLLVRSISANVFLRSRYLSREAFLRYEASNEPVNLFEPGCTLRRQVEDALANTSKVEDIPIVIGDEEIRTNDIVHQVSPFNHSRVVATFSHADENLLNKAIGVSLKARDAWERTPIEKRAEIFLRAADLMAREKRVDMLTTTMLGQGKTIYQAEIDATCELIDFLRFNVQFAGQVSSYSPISTQKQSNDFTLRGIEGFWAAVTPFNFTAIGAHLAAAPALMGNVCLWKPSDTAVLSNYAAYRIFREAGLPPGVINFVPSAGPTFGNTVTGSEDLAGLIFTGSVKTFRTLWQQVGERIGDYRYFPRLIGECGGKNFHLVHNSADITSVVNGTIRSAFEFGGQKCSACSRLYIPRSKAEIIKSRLLEQVKKIKLGSPLEMDTFFSAVIDEAAFDRISGYIDYAKTQSHLKILAGGEYDKSKGWFIQPTVIETTDLSDKLMTEEIFGPVLTLFVYEDSDWTNVIQTVDRSTMFALTGAIYSEDSSALEEAQQLLRQSAGNLYLNCQSTGSVVGQQPFGGHRMSGTNDKAGGPHFVLRFTSPLTTSEAKGQLPDWRQPHMQ